MDLNSGVILLPTAAVLLIAIATRSTLPALAGGVLLGHVLLDGPAAVLSLAESLTTQLTTPTVAWVVLVCGLLGAITQLLVRAGGTTAFAGLVAARVQTGRGGLLAAWAAGLMIFLDDYLNVLLIGGGLRPVTDRLRVPRERLAYVIDATAAPVCLLVPLSTWAIYVAGLLETSGAAAEGQGMAAYIGLIPWIFYGWFAIAIVPLFVCGWIPAWGAMRSADARVAAGGNVAPPDSPAEPEASDGPLTNERLSDFFLPVAALVVGTAVSGGDALRGSIWGLLTVVIQQGIVRRRMSAHALAETACRGIGLMVPALATILLAFMLQAINARLGLTEFVIDAAAARLPGALIPAVAFAVVSAVTFASGSFWGTYAIALPILVPLSLDAGMDPGLTAAAAISAGGFGSHACFFGDSTVLASQAAGCNNLEHARSQLPYAILGAGLTIAAYLAAGILSAKTLR
jgi:Na+/H+ antiporter NhaC